MGKDWKDKDQRGKDRYEKGKDDKENERCKTDSARDGKDNEEKEESLRSGRVVIKSCPAKLTRITLRGTKSKPIQSRPPWNTGTPSPTTTKVPSAQARRSVRILPTKVQKRPNVHIHEEPLSSLSQKDGHQAAASKAEPPPCAPSQEPMNLIIPLKDPKTGLEWDYKQLEEFLQHATEAPASHRAKDPRNATTTIQSPTSSQDRSVEQIFTEIELQDTRRNADAGAATFAASTEALRNAIKLLQPLREQAQEESFFGSELMTSLQLKMPVPSPALTKMQLRALKATQTSTMSTPRTNEQSSLKDKFASDRRRPYALAVLARGGDQNGPLIPTQAWPAPIFQLDQESEDGDTAPQRMTQSSPTEAKTQSPTFREWPISQLQLDPETSDDKQAAPQSAARPMPNMITVPNPGYSARPVGQLQLDPETSNEEYYPPQSARSLPNMIKVQYSGSRKLLIPQLRLDPEAADEGQDPQRVTSPYPQVKLDQQSLSDEQPAIQQPVEPIQLISRDQHPPPSTSNPTCARITRGDSPFHADGELSGEDYASKSRSIINRSRQLRESRSQSSIKSVKWDPAIIACGPITATREPPSQTKANALPEVSKVGPEKSKLEDNLEVFRKTVSHWKKADRKAIRKFLEALKNVDSDEELFARPQQASKKEANQSKTFSYTAPGKGLNPLAPVFREPSQKATDDSQQETSSLSARRKRRHSLGDNKEELLVSKEPIQTYKPIPRAIHSCCGPRFPELHEQKPLWINTFQPTIAPDQEDEDFREFCRANNFIPIVSANPNPVIPIAPPDPIIPFLTPYLNLKPDPVSLTYMLPLDDMQPNLPNIPTHLEQPTEKVSGIPFQMPAPITQHSYQPITDQGLAFILEETSEPIEDEGCREAKALDPVWGAQILENFVKKYPMTGQRKPEGPVSEQNENRKSAKNGQQTQRLKVEGKAVGVKAHIKRAAEIQQELEMILLQQRERKAPLAPAHKIRATEIQQKLEIMLYKLKEQKALEGFSKRVAKRAETEANIEKSFKSFEKNSEKYVYSSRSTSKSSEGAVEHIEKLR